MRKIMVIILIILGIILIGILYMTLIKSEVREKIEEREIAPNFSFTDINGNTRKLSDFRGKVVLIDFMATWCPPCKIQVQILHELWPQYKDKNVVFLSVSVDPRDKIDMLKKYAIQNNVDWIIGVSSDAGIKYKIQYIPTLIIVDRNGRIAFKSIGVTQASKLIEVLNREV